MGTLWRNEEIPLVEPLTCTPIYVSGVARAVVIEGDVHILWEIEQPTLDGMERVVALRTIMPVGTLRAARAKVDDALFERMHDGMDS